MSRWRDIFCRQPLSEPVNVSLLPDTREARASADWLEAVLADFSGTFVCISRRQAREFVTTFRELADALDQRRVLALPADALTHEKE